MSGSWCVFSVRTNGSQRTVHLVSNKQRSNCAVLVRNTVQSNVSTVDPCGFQYGSSRRQYEWTDRNSRWTCLLFRDVQIPARLRRSRSFAHATILVSSTCRRESIDTFGIYLSDLHLVLKTISKVWKFHFLTCVKFEFFSRTRCFRAFIGDSY